MIRWLHLIPKTPPTLPRLGTRRNPRANGRGHEQSKQRLVRRQRILIGIKTTAIDDTEHSTSRTRQDAGHVLGLWWWERYERSEIVRGAGIDPVEYEHMEMWRQVQRRPEPLNECDRAIMTARDPETPTRPSSLVGKEGT